MTRPAIHIDSLSKRYRIGQLQEHEETLVGTLLSAAKSPLANLSRLRRLSRFEDDESADVIWALRDLSLEIQPGEVVGIIGKNGAGKSTLLKILARITSPTAGRIELAGRAAALLEVGTGFHPELTGRENIYLNGTILGMRKSEVDTKLEEIIDFSGVEKFIDTPVKRYSSGMGVRLAFAIAAHLEPEILMIDEVLAVGDAEFQKKCLGKMDAVAAEGRTVLFVSHNLTAVRTLCKRAILLEGGYLVADGPVDEVANQYLAGAQTELTRQEWDSPETAPGNDRVRFKSISIEADPASRDIGVITLDTPMTVHCEIWNLTPGDVNLSLHLKRLGGDVVFASGSPSIDCGVTVARFACHIPGNLLNDGHYAVSMLVASQGTGLHWIHDGVTFEVHDTRRAGPWLGKWPGLVRPHLSWEYEVDSA